MLIHQAHQYSVYFAPRGKNRMLQLGTELAHRHLSDEDRLIGIIGEAGAGKSMLIKGMFPGLELSNDDEGVNVRPLPILECLDDEFNAHTYHLDIRFESAFTQMHELARAIRAAVQYGCHVVVEHFDLIYSAMGMNAELLIGVGEEVVVTRPTLFGPLPEDVANIVFKSLKYRKMAHSAEDLTERVIEDVFGYRERYMHGDVKRGFVLEYEHLPDFPIRRLEREVKQYIKNDYSISFKDETHICINDVISHYCTGPRLHVKSTGEIEDFSLLKDYKFDPIRKMYLVVGLVGTKEVQSGVDLNKFSV